MNFNLHEKAKENIIIVAHRGACGGNIPCNTLASYEIALKQGADMIEVDINRTRDGKLVVFHPGMEKAHFNKLTSIPMLSSKSVEKLRYVNTDNNPTQFGVASFDDFLEQFKGRCYINIDKFWSNPEKIYRDIKRHGMEDQVVVKSKLSEKVLSVLEEIAPDISFMPIVSESHPAHEELLKRKINYMGVEVLFKNDNSPLASEEFIEKMHRDNILVWVNSIIYNYKHSFRAVTVTIPPSPFRKNTAGAGLQTDLILSRPTGQ